MTNEESQRLRIVQILNALNLNQTQMAQVTGIKQSQLSKVIGGQKGLSAGMIERMLDQFPHININRVFTGLGPVLLPVGNSTRVEEPASPYGDKCAQLHAVRDHLVSCVQNIDMIIAKECQQKRKISMRNEMQIKKIPRKKG